MNLARTRARRDPLVRVGILLALTLVVSSISAVATAASAKPALAPGFARDIARLAPADTYAGFVHFRGGSAAEHTSFLRARGLEPASDFEVVDMWYAVGPKSAWMSLTTDPSVELLEDNKLFDLHLDTAKFAGRVAHAQTAIGGGPLRDASGRVLDGSGIGVAVVDSGVDGEHPDLVNRVARNFKVECSTPVLRQTSGERLGECFGPVHIEEMSDTDSSSGHGSHVSGIVAGEGVASNGTIRGVATGARLYGFGVGEGDRIIGLSAAAAFRWVLENGATQNPPIRIVTNSWGCNPADCPPDQFDGIRKLRDRLLDAGFLVVFSAGNSGGTGTTNQVNAYTDTTKPGLISVAWYDDNATGDRDFALSASSSRGLQSNQSTWPDISAPGQWILSSCHHDKPFCNTGQVPSPYQPYYAAISGTSMAAPFVTGVAAMMLQLNPSLTPAQVKDHLQDTAYKFTAGAPYVADPQNPDGTHSFDKGAGLVDAAAALQRAGAAVPGVGYAGAPSVSVSAPVDGATASNVTTVSGTATDGYADPASTVLGTDAPNDYEGPGALDVVTLSQSQSATGVTYTVTVRDAADLGPSGAVLYRLFQNVNGKVARTSLTCTTTGCTPSAFNAANNSAVATSASIDATTDTVTFFVPFSAYPSRTAPNAAAHNTRIAAFASTPAAASAQDVLPGGVSAQIDTEPQFTEPWILDPQVAAAPSVSVALSVDGGPATPATVTGTGPSYSWSGDVDLTGLSAGEHTITATVSVAGVPRASEEITVVVPTPEVELSTTSLSFGGVQPGDTSAAETVTVTNTGNADLVVSSATTTGDFAVAGDACTGVAVAPSASCAIQVTSSPTMGGARSGSLSIASNAVGGSHAVALSGVGLDPAIALTPSSISFGNVAVGYPSTARTVTAKNVGAEPAVMGPLSLTGADASAFTIVTNGCTSTLAPGGSCSFSVRFGPSAAGPHAAAIDVTSNAPTVTLAMTGNGFVGAPAVSFSASTLSFGTLATGAVSGERSVSLRNSGNAPLAITSVSLSGADASQFTKGTDTCAGRTLNPGASCVARATFRPTAEGAFTAQLVFVTNAASSPDVVTLAGTGALDVTPTTSSFNTRDGAVLVGGFHRVTGTTTDDLSGVTSVSLTYTSATGSSSTVSLPLSCNSARTSCTWSWTAPLTPGPATVSVRGTDAHGNVEEAKTISVTIV